MEKAKNQEYVNLDEGIIIIDSSGYIKYANDEALKIFDYTYNELKGQSLSILMFEKDSLFHQKFINRAINNENESNLNSGRNVIGKNKFGKKIDLFISVKKGNYNSQQVFIGRIKDINKSITKSITDHTSIFVISDEFKIGIDIQGRIKNVIDFCDLFGYTFSESFSNSIFSFVEFSHQSSLIKIFEKIKLGTNLKNELIYFKKKDGSRLYLSWSSFLIHIPNLNNDYFHQQIVIASDITQIINQEKQISVLSSVINKSPIGLAITDTSGYIEFANDSFKSNLGINQKQIINQNLFSESFYIDYKEKNNIYHSIKNNNFWQNEISVLVNKEKKHFLITIFGIRDPDNEIINFLEEVQDITPWYSYYYQIQIEKEKFENILKSLPEGILVLDMDSNVIEVNNSFNKLYESLYNSLFRISNIIKNDDSNEIMTKLKYMLLNKKKSIIVVPRKGLILEFFRIENRDNEIIIIYDKSEEFKLNSLRQQLISTVSHELRTPISVIIQSIHNYIKYEDKLKELEKQKLLEITQLNSQLLADIVDDLLIMSRIDDNGLQLSISEVNITKLTLNVIKQLDPKAEVKNLKIHLSSEENLVTFGDSKRLSQVIRIILDNAIKYSRENTKIEISISRLVLSSGEREIKLQIKDQGIGISEEDLSHLFTRFFRAKNTTNIKGTGLGLSIAKELIELHKGRIEVNSTFGEGSVFKIYLPFRDI